MEWGARDVLAIPLRYRNARWIRTAGASHFCLPFAVPGHLAYYKYVVRQRTGAGDEQRFCGVIGPQRLPEHRASSAIFALWDLRLRNHWKRSASSWSLRALETPRGKSLCYKPPWPPSREERFLSRISGWPYMKYTSGKLRRQRLAHERACACLWVLEEWERLATFVKANLHRTKLIRSYLPCLPKSCSLVPTNQAASFSIPAEPLGYLGLPFLATPYHLHQDDCFPRVLSHLAVSWRTHLY